jgi:hypothetical protein
MCVPSVAGRKEVGSFVGGSSLEWAGQAASELAERIMGIRAVEVRQLGTRTPSKQLERAGPRDRLIALRFATKL